jgi:hypothetical protein
MTTTDRSTADVDEAKKDRPPFTAWLSDHRNGALAAELTEKFGDLVEAVTRHGKAGSLVLTLKINPSGDYQMIVKDSVTAKAPSPPAPETFYFADGNGGLSRRDPRQPQLPNIDH